MDSAFAAVGKPLPEPAPPELKPPPPAKGKKGKDSKKGEIALHGAGLSSGGQLVKFLPIIQPKNTLTSGVVGECYTA